MLLDTFQRRAIVTLTIRFPSQRSISVSSQRFSKVFSFIMEKIHDCHTLMFNRNLQELIGITTFSNPINIDVEMWHTDMTPHSSSESTPLNLFN